MEFDVPGRVDFSIAEAQWLADLHGVQEDLRATDRLCTKSLTLLRPSPQEQEQLAVWFEDTWLAGELAFAAVIKYGRTFGSGARAGIPMAWINSLPTPYQECHRYFKDLRDKFIAHSVNAFEDNQVFAYLSPQFAPTQVSSITVDTGRFTALSTTEVGNLSQLTRALTQITALEISQETARVLAIARAFPLAEMLVRSTENRPIPGRELVGKRRPKA